MTEDLKKLEQKLDENKELVDELEGDLEAEKGDDLGTSLVFGKLMVAQGKQKEILDKINKIKKNSL